MKEQWMAIFKAGDYKSKGKYSESDLDQMIERFNDEGNSIPITLDHAKKGPAYGWVNRLTREGDTLYAQLEKVEPALVSAIEKGQYQNRSVEIVPNFDKKGHRLQAVTFLGARIPEIKDLEPLTFQSGKKVKTILFQEDTSMDEDQREALEQSQHQVDRLEADLSRLMEENAQLRNQLKANKQNEKKMKAENCCNDLIQQGKILPAEKESIMMTFEALDDEAIYFSEGHSLSPFEKYKQSLERHPAIQFGEMIQNPLEEQYNFSVEDGQRISYTEVETEAKKQGVSLSDRGAMARIAKEVLNRSML